MQKCCDIADTSIINHKLYQISFANSFKTLWYIFLSTLSDIMQFNYYASLNLIKAIKQDPDRNYKEFMASIILNFTTSGYK